MTAVLLVGSSQSCVGITSNESKMLEFKFLLVMEQFFHVAGTGFTPLELRRSSVNSKL